VLVANTNPEAGLPLLLTSDTELGQLLLEGVLGATGAKPKVLAPCVKDLAHLGRAGPRRVQSACATRKQLSKKKKYLHIQILCLDHSPGEQLSGEHKGL